MSDLIKVILNGMSLDEIEYGLVSGFVLGFVFHSELDSFGFYCTLGYLQAETCVSLQGLYRLDSRELLFDAFIENGYLFGIRYRFQLLRLATNRRQQLIMIMFLS